jgi:hypothetical protein
MNYPFEKEQVVTQEFGENAGNYAQYGMVAHNGIDFGCPRGTNVLAAAEGVVERADFDDNGYGFYIQIAHADGLTTVYAHLGQIRVQPHNTVKAGQLIGQSGSTGNSTGPHLHFEVRRKGLEKNGYWGAIDPRPLLAWPGTVPAVAVGPGTVYQVKAGTLNVRSGAGTQYPIVGRLSLGDEIGVVELVTPEIWGKLPDGRYIALEFHGSVLAFKK